MGWMRKMGTQRMCAIQAVEKGVDLPDEETPEDVLQTVTMSLAEVRKNLGAWIEPMKAEYNSLVSETQAILPVDVSSLGPQKVEFVPGKLVCVVKAGPKGGKKKCRGVICGNLMESDPSPIGVYASGADGTLIRTVLRHSVLAGWGCDVTDIKTAFLLAPRVASPNQREAIVIPPRILVDAKICSPTKRWRIQKALYGLPSSPACWALYRDRCMKSFEWEKNGCRYGMKQTAEGNLWEILETPKTPIGKDLEPQRVGRVLVYVDDMMVLGPPTVRQGFLDRITQEWNCAPSETVTSNKWTRFSGFEFQRGPDEKSLKIGQGSYVRELLNRHTDVVERSTPMPKWELDADPEEEVTTELIRMAQAITGELLWASVRSRPDISFAVSIMGQQVTKRPRWVVKLHKHVLGFLMSTKDHCLWYRPEMESHGSEGTLQIPRHETLIEAFSDVSFAPNGEKSHQGVLLLYAGGLVQWEANKQSFCTLSTAESELMAAIEAMQMTQSVEALLNVIKPEVTFEKVLYGDNSSSLAILQNPDGPWRTRHLRLRSHCLREKLRCESGSWKVRRQSGSTLMADLLTKPISQTSSWKRFWAFLEFWTGEWTMSSVSGVSNGSGSSEPQDVEASRVKKTNEVKLQIAKVGVLLGLVERVGSFGYQEEMVTVLVFSLALLLVYFLIELKKRVSEYLPQSVDVVQAAFHKVKRLKLDDQGESKNQEKKEQQELERIWRRKDSGQRRENEPRLDPQKKGEKMNKKDRSGQRRDDEPRCEQEFEKSPTPEVVFGKSLKDFCGTEVEGRDDDPLFGELNPCGTAGQKNIGVVRCSGDWRDSSPVKEESSAFSLGYQVHRCPQGCPLGKSRAGRRAMDPAAAPRIAALRAGGKEEQIWEKDLFQSPPSWSKDRWVTTMLQDKWLIRAHGQERVRKFHPLHRSVPIPPESLTGQRISVGYFKDIQVDAWTKPPTNLADPKKVWKGWTILRLKDEMAFSPTMTPQVTRPMVGVSTAARASSSTVESSVVERVEGVVEVTFQVGSSSNEQLWRTAGSDHEGSSQKGRAASSFVSGGLPHGKGYFQDTITNKGIFVAQQLPVPPKNSQTEFENDDSSEDWEEVSETG